VGIAEGVALSEGVVVEVARAVCDAVGVGVVDTTAVIGEVEFTGTFPVVLQATIMRQNKYEEK